MSHNHEFFSPIAAWAALPSAPPLNQLHGAGGNANGLIQVGECGQDLSAHTSFPYNSAHTFLIGCDLSVDECVGA